MRKGEALALRWADIDLTRRVAHVRRTLSMHDLRHLAASMMIPAGVPLAVVSKTLRHSTVAITGDIYAHLTAEVAREAVDAMAAALDAARAEAGAIGRARAALTEHTVSALDALMHSPGAHIEDGRTA
jgi:integrase